jgi:hypothetical protein
MSYRKKPELPFWLVLTLFVLMALYPPLDAIATDVIRGQSLGQAIEHQLPVGGLYIAATAFLVDGLVHLWMMPMYHRNRAYAFRVCWLVLNSGALFLLLAVVGYNTLRYFAPDALRLQAWSTAVEISALSLSVVWWICARVLFRHGRLWLKPAHIAIIAGFLVAIPAVISARY